MSDINTYVYLHCYTTINVAIRVMLRSVCYVLTLHLVRKEACFSSQTVTSHCTKCIMLLGTSLIPAAICRPSWIDGLDSILSL